MSDEENDSIFGQTSDYFSESTPKSLQSIDFDHKYALSPSLSLTTSSSCHSTTSLTPNNSNRKSIKKQKLLKRRRLFDRDLEIKRGIESNVTPLSERQQLAIALQLSSYQSQCFDINTNNTLFQTNNALRSGETTERVRRNPKGETDLHISAIKGDLNRVQQIISKNKYDIDITDFAGWSPIHEACNRGFVSIVEELLKAGSNVNARGYNKDTPLIDAAVNGHHLIVELLLKYGADYTLTNGSHKSALEVAKSVRVVEVIQSFIEEKMRKNGGNNKDMVSKSRSNSPPNGSSPQKSSSPRLTLRFQTIKDSKQTTTVTNTTNNTSNSVMASTKTYCVSTASDKEVSNDLNIDKHNDNNRTNTSNGSASDAVAASSDHTYTSFDSQMTASDESSRGRKRRKSNDGSVSSTSSLSGGPSPRSVSTSSVSSATQSNKEWHNKKHHHQHQHPHHPHHHHINHSNKSINSKDKSVKKLFGSSSDSEGIDGSECDKESNLKDNPSVGSTESSPKVPPLRIVLPASTSNTTSASSATTVSTGSHSSVSSSVTSSTTTSGAKFPYVVSSEEAFQSESESISGVVGSQRITRSSQRVAQQQSQRSNNTADHHSDGEESAPQTDSQHPRKRKIRNNNNINDNKININNNSVNNSNGDNDNDSSSSTSSVIQTPKDISPFALPQTNCYQMFLSIRKNVDKRRKEMFSVQPKAPQGFDDYLLNRCSYLLEGKSVTTGVKSVSNAMEKPSLEVPPNSLPGTRMHDIFTEQEKQRYKLKVQHLIERQKLVLSAEQEIIRVHGRAARAMANQTVPFSVCSILKDEEIYNICESEAEQNDSLSNQIKSDKSLVTGTSGLSANRTRYNGRLFISWLQDVYDKWKKIKEVMILRHNKESESMFAMQRLEWEWKLKEFGVCDLKSSPKIDDKHVPKVQVIDDFELFPV